MYCSKCGSQVDGKFCPNCGTSATAEPEELQMSPTAENITPCDSATQKNEAKQNDILLEKTKMLGAIRYKTIKTAISIKDSSVEIKMDVKKIFCKVRTVEKIIPVASIQTARVHTVMDFWDTLYGIIFAVLGFLSPVLLLLAAVCLWCGYGKEIELLLNNGEKFHIPTGSGSSANAVIELLNRR